MGELAEDIQTCALEVNELRYELNQLDRSIEELKLPIDYSIAFDKDLKNGEQREVQRKLNYEENDNLQTKIDLRSDKNKALKDKEVRLEYLRNLLKLDLALPRNLEDYR